MKSGTLLTVDGHVATSRAAHQTMLTHHFGGEIIDELFEMLNGKIAASPLYANPNNDATIVLLAILERKIV